MQNERKRTHPECVNFFLVFHINDERECGQKKLFESRINISWVVERRTHEGLNRPWEKRERVKKLFCRDFFSLVKLQILFLLLFLSVFSFLSLRFLVSLLFHEVIYEYTFYFIYIYIFSFPSGFYRLLYLFFSCIN